MKNFESVLETYRLAKSELSEILSSCELIDRMSVENAKSSLGLRSPLTDQHEFYVLIETAGSNSAHDEEKVEAFLTKLMERGIIDDGTVTSEPSKVKVSVFIFYY